MPAGKSWSCVCKISRTWKVLENEVCPGKSSKSECKVLKSPEIAIMMRMVETVMQAAGAEKLLNFCP